MTTKKTETRARKIAFRADDSDSKFELTGVAAAYGVPTDVGGNFQEVIAPGAFARALREKQDVRALLNHNADVVLSRTSSGTLTLTDSPEGLRFVIRLDRNQSKHHDVFSAVQRGDWNQMSFAFKAAKGGERWEQRNGTPVRTLTDVDLFDISVVTYPCYGGSATSVSARAAGADDAALDAYHVQRAKELEAEIFMSAPGYVITDDPSRPSGFRVLPMSREEADAREDARNRLRAEEIAEEIRQDEVRRRFAELKEELGGL